MLFGGRAAFRPESGSTVDRSAEILCRDMTSVFPQLVEAKIEYVWGGTLDFAWDVMPHAGQIDGMHFAIGYAGHGVAAATWMGARLASAIWGDHSINPYAKIPFPVAPLGLRAGNTWALPLALAYYKVLDWF
jgi:glycine/D-amino acid oxidase-like deaminating enzyme